MRNAELDTFVSQVKSIADKHGFDFDFTQAGKWYEFNLTGERQNFIISVEDTRDIYPNPHSSYDTLGFDIDEFVRQVNNRIRQAELSLDYESREDVIKRHQGRKDIEECAHDSSVFIRDISKELKSLARQYGATEVKDSKQLKNNNMKRVRDSYGKARVYQNLSGTWKVELNLGGTLHYFNASTKDEAVEIANKQTNGGKVVIEDSRKVSDAEDIKDRRAEAAYYADIANKMNAYLGKTAPELEDILSKKFGLHLVDFSLFDGTYENFIEFWSKEEKPNGYGIILTFSSDWGKKPEQVLVEVDFHVLERFYKKKEFMMKRKYKSVYDSRKIKDAEDIVPLDGLLMVAFKDGQEEDGLKAIQGHANESGELEGVKYETYNVDEQDGVAVVDMCAVTNDANAFVKVLLKEWGVIDAVADLDFKKSDEMQNAEEQVSDSKVSDDAPRRFRPVTPKINMYERGVGYEHPSDIARRNYEMRQYLKEQGVPEWEIDDILKETVKDSRVNDMTKPVHLRGYAEKVRAKRRQQKEAYKENQEEEDKQEVSDSRMIKDSTGLNFEIIYEMNDDQFADFVDEIITIFEWYYGEDMPDVVNDLFTPMIITRDDMVNVLGALGYEELDKILSAYGANNSYDSVIDELFL